MNASKQTVGIQPAFSHAAMPGRYTPPYRDSPMRRVPQTPSNLFGGLDDGLLARAEALADISKNTSPPGLVKPESIYGHADMSAHNSAAPRSAQFHSFGAPGESMLEQISAASMPISGISEHSCAISSTHARSQMYSPVYSHPHCGNMNSHPGLPASHHPGAAAMHPHPAMHSDLDCDPRELEAFAERFKQRRIKLGVTQADVGNALGKLKLPGVGSLSQSTICRFESLTLSHNNMIALKPILLAWLEEAEKAARENKNQEVLNGALDKKRKRTSIAAPEKRSLEAYFAVQPRPSGEKIAQIAEKLDLKKNVVRVWFCNQRQKQKRMKFSAINMQGAAAAHQAH